LRLIDAERLGTPAHLHAGTAQFDAAYCWGYSFGYFDHAKCVEFLSVVARALKPGGRFALDTGIAAESILPTLAPEQHYTFGDLQFDSAARYDAVDGRLDIDYTFTQGEVCERKSVHQWVHCTSELRRMFSNVGLNPVAAYGGTDGGRYQLRSRRLILIAERGAGLQPATG
jgi:SAM-dependent methyltransferase